MAHPLILRPAAAGLALLLSALTLCAPGIPSPSRAAQLEAPAAPAKPGDAAKSNDAARPGDAAKPGDRATSDPRSAGTEAEAAKMTPAMTLWVRQVHAAVIKATGGISRRLAPGTYHVGFAVDEHGRGSNYSAEGADPKQTSMIMGALVSRSFPAPPDGASHAVRFVLRNGSPTAKPSAEAKSPADGAKP